jgi:hypothetical protein
MTYPIINTLESNNLAYLRDMFKDYVKKSTTINVNREDIRITVYRNIEYIIGGRQVLVSDVINDIRTKSGRREVPVKEMLPVGYFSVTCFNGRKTNLNANSHTGLIIIDIDKKDNPTSDFIELKKALMQDKIVYACFTSPSGGLKIIVRTNIKSVEHHEAYYNSVRKYFLSAYAEMKKIDTSGSNISRACYLPYDANAFYNPNAYDYCLTDEEISQINADILKYKSIRNPNALTLDLDFISFDEHFDNIYNLIKNRTSVGLSSDGDDDEKRTSVGLLCNDEGNDDENRTSVGLLSVDNDNEERTSVGLYDNIFNRYRYYDIQKKVMSTNVPFFELLLWKYYNPNGRNNGLDYSTHIDEHYFKANPQKPISVDSIEGSDGLDVCEIRFKKDSIIREGQRGKTLTSITVKLIFNNPFCHPSYLLQEVGRINDVFCEDPNPIDNPKPDELEILTIVTNTYNKYLDGTLDFSRVIRKKRMAGKITKRYVFFSRDYVSVNEKDKQLRAIRTFQDGRKEKVCQKHHEAIHALQDGRKITKKRIADYMCMTTRNLRRYDTKAYDAQIKNYNDALK